ncbi:MAG: pantoate--beta-alanine ligase [Ignavibacteriaceae bacterium]|nr:pantoate--beta-alanine ligase [Ignavibacteriaceae bacterium]
MVKKLKREGKSIGFVPTMGYLHIGHLSLIRESKKKADITIASIFVNPTQFAPNEDFNRYPKDLERDKNLLEAEGTDYLFNPDAAEIYPDDYQTYISLNKITQPLEGIVRPGHYKGVSTIVSILLNCVQPDFAFFGQKDAQQAAVIKQMVKDLKYGVEVVVCPISREADGLAMSSRNIFLSEEDRQKALTLHKSLSAGAAAIKAGERSSEKLIDLMSSYFLKEKTVFDYLTIVDANTFEGVAVLTSPGEYYILTAAKIGNTRLIDNELIKI